MDIFPVLAQTSPQEILESQYNVSVNLSEIFAGLRAEVLTGQIFFVTSTIGAGITALSAGWYFSEGVKAHSLDSEQSVWRAYLPAILGIALVAILIGNPTGRGSFLGRLVDSSAHLMDNIANYTLREISLNLNTDVIQAATVETQVEILVDAGISRCAEIQDDGDRDDCLIAVQDQAQDFIDPWRNELPVDAEGNQVGTEWAQRLLFKVQDRIREELDDRDSNYTSRTFVRAFTNASFPKIQTFIVGFLWLIAAIFGYVQQVSIVLMAATSPIFLALNLSPLHRGAFTRWAVGFINLGLFKVTFYILSSLAAWASLLSDVDPNIFPLIVAVTSIVYSWQIISGGGAALAFAPAGAVATGGAIIQGARNFIRRK